MPSDQDWIDAYLRERAGAARRGQAERVALIDAELARLGHTTQPVDRHAPVAETTAPDRPARRPRTKRADTITPSKEQ